MICTILFCKKKQYLFLIVSSVIFFFMNCSYSQTLDFPYFDSLPNEHGWTYYTNTSDTIFTINDSILVQNSFGKGNVSGFYKLGRGSVIDPASNWSLKIKAKLIAVEEPNSGFFFNVIQNHLLYSVRLTLTEIFILEEKDGQHKIINHDNSIYHDFTLIGGPAENCILFVDSIETANFIPVQLDSHSTIPNYDLAFGDGTIKENVNAHGEWARYTFTQKYIHPVITSIVDIPNDQGGWVIVQFAKSAFDTDSLILAKTSSAELYTVEIDDGSGWTSAAATGAYGKSIYSVLVPTTKDSTSESDGLIDFRVIAGMDEGNYVSRTVSGYSVDNLVPSFPENLTAVQGESESILLNWAVSPEKDFQYFNIYRNTENFFDNSSEVISGTTENNFNDTNIEYGTTYFYAVKAVDFSGNMSDYSMPASVSVTSINGTENNIPNIYFMKQNYPNPFNPATVISYGLPQAANVKITIYDVAGREIFKLVNEKQNAGKYTAKWDGLDKSGRKAASGLYIYKIEAGHFSKTNKMILIR